MCNHKWVPYKLTALHPCEIAKEGYTTVYQGITLGMVTTVVKCVECGEEEELTKQSKRKEEGSETKDI